MEYKYSNTTGVYQKIYAKMQAYSTGKGDVYNMIFTYQQIASLNETEMIIYHYIIKNIEKIQYMGIREFANNTHVSTATISRFCQKFECSGYAEFKYQLRVFNEKAQIPQLNHEIDSLLNFFKYVNSEEFYKRLDRVVDCIKEADSICFIGIGTSGILGEYGARFFSNVGYHSVSIKDPYYPAPINSSRNNLIIALSVSGENPQVIDQLKMYQSKSSKILAITNTTSSTISKMADITIPYYIKEILLPQTYNITSQVPVVYILERIARKLQREKNVLKK
jgi:DNA-binding MurR/RpiR family transcriptional regulator